MAVIMFVDEICGRRTKGVIFALVVFVCSFVSSTSNANAGAVANNCESVVAYFQSKGFTVPQQHQQQQPSMPSNDNGSLCGRNSCCPPPFERHLAAATRRQLHGFVRATLERVAFVLEKRARRFDAIFKEMMNKSKLEFDEMFRKTYGLIYLQNSVVFTDFFEDLERYYHRGNIKLSEALENFFAVLYQRMFKVINAQYKFDDRYLACVAEHMTELRPFGDVPNKLGVQLKRSFVATRTFYKAINVAATVAARLQHATLTDAECVDAMTTVQYCGACGGGGDANYRRGTCFKYCHAMAAQCFRHFGVLGRKWDDFVDAIDKVGKRLIGPFNIEMVVEPINIKISDAVMAFQENGADVSKKVFSGCGNPVLGRRRRAAAATSTPAAAARDQKKSVNAEITFQPLYAGGNGNGNNKKRKNRKDGNKHGDEKKPILQRQIIDIIDAVKDTRQLWTYLPVQYCNGNNITSSDPNCWNGTRPEATASNSSTSTASSTSTSSSSSVARTPQQILEQIYTLDVWIGKLQAAYQGQEVDLVDDSEDTLTDDDGDRDASGSGSGDDSPIDSPIDSDDDDDEENRLNNDVVTTTSTSTTTQRINATSSIDVDDGDDDGYLESNVIPDADGTTSSVSGGTSTNVQLPSLVRALIQYVLPIVFACFGGAISDLL